MAEARPEMVLLRRGGLAHQEGYDGRSYPPCHGGDETLNRALWNSNCSLGIAGRKLEGFYLGGETCAQPSYCPFDGAEHRGV
jgi:hypothetical protein